MQRTWLGGGQPPIEWIRDRVGKLHDVLEQPAGHTAQALRDILGPIRMELVTPDVGRAGYRTVTSSDALALTESPPGGAEGDSNAWQRWRLWDDFEPAPI